MPERLPHATTHQAMLRQWGDTCARALEEMIADIRAGKLVDDTMERHFDYLRHLMGRREVIVNEIRLANSRHRGPGTPGYHDLGGDGHVAH